MPRREADKSATRRGFRATGFEQVSLFLAGAYHGGMNQQGERKVRRVRFEALEDGDTWDTIRSCDPVRADGVTPLTGRQRFDDVEYRALTRGVKHRF